MRWHQHYHQAIFGLVPRREVKQVSPGPHHGGEARVCIIGAEKSLEKKMGEVLSAQGKEMSEIKSNLAALSTQMAAMMEEVKKNRIDRYRAPSRSPSPRGSRSNRPQTKSALVKSAPSQIGPIFVVYYCRHAKLNSLNTIQQNI